VIDDAILIQQMEQIRADEPGVLAIVLHGSYAKGQAGRYSDIDLDVMMQGEPATKYKMLLVEAGNVTCLGLTGRETSITDVYRSAMRQAQGVIELMRAHPAASTADITPDIPLYLADGRIQRYLAQ
jgi:hypothetical protein